MKYLFNSKSFPVATGARQIAPLLRQKFVRAVHYHSFLHEAIVNQMKAGVIAYSSPALAQKYRDAKDSKGHDFIIGQKAFLEPFEPKDIMKAAKDAAIQIDPAILRSVTAYLNSIRTTSERVFTDYMGLKNFNTVARLFFVPKGGTGRTSVPHVDNLPVSCHVPLALSPLEMFVPKHVPEKIWQMVMQAKNKHDYGSAKNYYAEIQDAMKDYGHRFKAGPTGHPTFLLGQKGRIEGTSQTKEKMGIHASSPKIEDLGNAAVLFYPHH